MMWVEGLGVFFLFCNLIPFLYCSKTNASVSTTTRAFALIARVVRDGQSKYEILHFDSSCEESITVAELFEAYPEYANSQVSIKSTFLSKSSALEDNAVINIIA